MRIIAITAIALLACCCIAAAAFWTEISPTAKTGSVEWAAAEGGKILRTGDPENLDHFFRKAPIPLLNGEGRPSEHVDDILEDMRVMTAALGQLIHDAFPDDNPHIQHVMIRSYYLGSGCVFLADLPFHVAGVEAQSADQPSDEAWDAARRKLGYAARAAVPPDRAERLKTALQSALALAKNIRHFKTDDFIAVAAVGRSGPPAKSILTARASFNDLSAVQFDSEWTGNPSTQGDSAALGRVIDKLLRVKLRNRFGGGPMEVRIDGSSTGISSIGSPVGEGVLSLYLKGYGALFYTDVHYPVGINDADNDPPADLWQESLRELQSGSQTDPGLDMYAMMPHRRLPTDQEAVVLRGQTADAILEALRYGSRIRGMGPDEPLIVSIRGYDGSSLVFRALKRDADAYGSGALDINAFREKVSVQMDMRPLSWGAVMQSSALSDDTTRLTISENGSMTLDGAAVTMEQLKERLNAAPENKKKTLIIRSNPRVPHKQIVNAVELANEAGVAKIGFTIEPRKPNVTKGEEK